MKNTKIKYILLFFAVFVLLLPLHTTAQQQWFELGTGENSLKANRAIYALCTDTNNNVYAAGEFTEDPFNPGTSGFYVAKWDAATHHWSELGIGTHALNANSGISTLAIDKKSGYIYAAGAFWDTVSHEYVAKWDPQSETWSELGTGANSIYANGIINTLCIDDSGHVYAAGNFSDGLGYYYVTKWNGTNWQTLSGLNANLFINSICVDDSFNVYATGNFSDFSGHQYVAKWNHSTGLWEELGSGFFADSTNVDITSIFVDSIHNVYAAVNFQSVSYGIITCNVYQWDGSNWGNFGNLNGNNMIETICMGDSGYIYAAGEFTDSFGKYFIAKCNAQDSAWGKLDNASLPYHFNWFTLALCTDKDSHVYAAGLFYDSTYHPNKFKYVAEFGINNLSVSAMQQNDDPISIFPNPSLDIIHISFKQAPIRNVKYELFDAFAQPCLKGYLIANKENNDIDLKSIISGTYVLKIDEQYIYKITKK